MRFKDRADAGRQLADKLIGYKPNKPLVLALPRGGVPVGFEVAKALDTTLDTIVARKIGAPSNPEFGVGAIAPGGVLVLDAGILHFLGLKQEDFEDIIKQEKQELKRRITKYKSGQWSKGVPTDTIIVVDDGLATGVTARAALESVRAVYKPKELVFASPVCALDSLESLRPYADKIVCVSELESLTAIGERYEDFSQTLDEEVLYYLNKAYEQKKGTRQ